MKYTEISFLWCVC